MSTEEPINEILTDLVGNWSRASDLQGKFDAINQAKSDLTSRQRELAQTILARIKQCEQELEDFKPYAYEYVQGILGVIDDIRQLCQKEVGQQDEVKRPIKFRGKINGQWAYATLGDVFPPDSIGYCSWSYFWLCADRKTVGGFTGRTDEDDREVYEDDIAQHVTSEDDSTDRITASIDVVEWSESGEFQFFVDSLSQRYIIKVLGNLHDNPEMVPEYYKQSKKELERTEGDNP